MCHVGLVQPECLRSQRHLQGVGRIRLGRSLRLPLSRASIGRRLNGQGRTSRNKIPPSAFGTSSTPPDRAVAQRLDPSLFKADISSAIKKSGDRNRHCRQRFDRLMTHLSALMIVFLMPFRTAPAHIMLLRSIAIEEIMRQRPPKFNHSHQRVRNL